MQQQGKPHLESFRFVSLLLPERTVEAIQFSGDFIANPAGIQALEHNLEGCPLEKAVLWQVIDQTFLEPELLSDWGGEVSRLCRD